MHRFLVCSLVLLAIVSFSLPTLAEETGNGIPSPESVFGFLPGTDRQLIDYSQLIDYLALVDRASARVAIQEIGRTTLDRPMKLVFISSPENIERLDELREINRRLALDPAIPDGELAGTHRRGPGLRHGHPVDALHRGGAGPDPAAADLLSWPRPRIPRF